MRAVLGFCCIALLMGVATFAGEATSAPKPADAGAIKPLTQDSSIDDILLALQSRGQGLQDFVCNVRLTDTDTATQDSSASIGKVYFQKKPDGSARIRVSFDKRQAGDRIYNEPHEYLLDGQWLTELDAKNKKIIRRQILKPGEKINVLKLGEGPFPLPIGQDPADVKKQFDVTKVPPAKDDPAGTIHVRLVPKKDSQFAKRFHQIEVWIDPKADMPVRIETLDPNQTEDRTTDLSDVKVNAGVKDADFALPNPGPDWSTVVEPYGE